MGRAKIAMEFISKEKTRNATYVKRKKGLIKKCYEFSILCNVPVCIIIYPYKEGKLSLQPEVYAFSINDALNSGSGSGSGLGSDTDRISQSNRLDLARARDPEVARQIINRYLLIPKEEKGKRALNLYDMFDEWKRKADQELTKLRQKNALAKYPTWDIAFDGFNPDQLMGLLLNFDQKLDFVRQRIALIKGAQIQGGLNPFFDPRLFDPTPISSLMVPSNINTHHHQMGCIDFEVMNQSSIFNFHPNEITHQDFKQVIPFDPNGFPGQVDPLTPSQHDYGGVNNNLVMYNMEVMEVGPTSYDHQGSGIVDHVAVAASSYQGETSLSMSMPLQLPVLSSVQMPRQCQMFYDK